MKNLSFSSMEDLKNFLFPIRDFLNLTDDVNSYLSDSTYFHYGVLPSKYFIYLKGYEALHVIHEFSHCIELSMNNKIKRLKYGTIGFDYKTKVVLMNNVYNEPRTSQGFEREIRTLAIEYFIINHYKDLLKLKQFEIIHLLRESIDGICTHMNDAYNFKYDINKMGIVGKNISKNKFIAQVFKRVLLEMGNLDINIILKHKNKVKKYLKKRSQCNVYNN